MRGLVEQKNLRIVSQGLGETDPLAHAFAEGAELAIPRILEIDLVESGIGAPARLGLIEAGQPQQGQQEIAGGQSLPEGVELGTQAHVVEQLRRAPNPPAENLHLALTGRELPCGQLEEGGLARAIGTQQPRHPGAELHRNVVQRDNGPVPTGSARELDARRLGGFGHFTTSTARTREWRIRRHPVATKASTIAASGHAIGSIRRGSHPEEGHAQRSQVGLQGEQGRDFQVKTRLQDPPDDLEDHEQPEEREPSDATAPGEGRDGQGQQAQRRADHQGMEDDGRADPRELPLQEVVRGEGQPGDVEQQRRNQRDGEVEGHQHAELPQDVVSPRQRAGKVDEDSPAAKVAPPPTPTLRRS